MMNNGIYDNVVIVSSNDQIYRFEKRQQTKVKINLDECYIFGDKHIIMSKVFNKKFENYLIDPSTWKTRKIDLDDCTIIASQGDNVVFYRKEDRKPLLVYNVFTKQIVRELNIQFSDTLLNLIFSQDSTKYIAIEDGLHAESYYNNSLTEHKIVFLRYKDDGYVWFLAYNKDFSKFCVVIKYQNDENTYGFICEDQILVRRVINISHPHYTEDNKLYYVANNRIVEDADCPCNQFEKIDRNVVPLYYKNGFELVTLSDYKIDDFYSVL